MSTTLKEQIIELVERNPDLSDQSVAELIFKQNNPGETYDGTGPTIAHVGRTRKAHKAMKVASKFSYELDSEFKEPEPKEDEEPGSDEEAIESDEPIIELELDDIIPPEPDEEFVFIDLGYLVIFVFDLAADSTGYEGWRFTVDKNGELTEQKEIRFVQLSQKMLDKYATDIFDKYFMEITFGISALAIVGGRARGYMAYKKEHPEETKKK